MDDPNTVSKAASNSWLYGVTIGPEHLLTRVADIIEDIPTMLFNARRARGQSMTDVCKSTGLGVSTLSGIESGVVVPSQRSIIEILYWLDGT